MEKIIKPYIENASTSLPVMDHLSGHLTDKVTGKMTELEMD